MTVCETKTVHEDYGKICDEFETIYVPSQFCKDVLSEQFPKNNFITLHAHIPSPKKFKPYTTIDLGMWMVLVFVFTTTIDKLTNKVKILSNKFDEMIKHERLIE